MPTPNFGLPLYTTSDTAALDTLLNGQSNAIDTALAANSNRLIGLDSARSALTPPKRKEGLTWYSTDTDREWFYDGTNWLSYNNGAYIIRPTSVTAGATIQTDGSVSLGTTLADVYINGVFSSRFRQYKVYMDLRYSGGNNAVSVQFAAGGVAHSAASYHSQALTASNTTTSPSQATGAGSFTTSGIYAEEHSIEMLVVNPTDSSRYTKFHLLSTAVLGASGNVMQLGGGLLVGTPMDGIRVFLQITGSKFFNGGSISVHGLV